MSSIAVRLRANLTRYHSALVPGIEGRTVESGGMWSRASDRFVPVSFPGAGIHDVLWESLEIVDADYLAEAAARRADKAEALRTATNVIKTVGPRGGFKYLSYEYIAKDGVRQHVSTGFRSEAEEVIAVLERYGISVEERRL
jgi:hypothetical protein